MSVNNHHFLKMILFFALIGWAVGTEAQVRKMPESRQQIQLTFAPVVADTAPAVVNIYTKKIVRSNMFDDPFFQRFLNDKFSFGMPRDRVQGSLGSGVVIRPDGVIVTNNHVIEKADEITVVLSDRREFKAKIVLADPRTDLAVLQIDTGGEELASLSLSDSDQIAVGDLVLAIGNPFGIGQSVSSGIISATARTQAGISDYGFFIQTDAAVNPGNSGGALVNTNGELLGINTAIYSRTGASNGISFAIPANMVKSVIRAALNEGEIQRPWLGLAGQNVTTDLAASLGLDRAGGVLISRLFEGGPADQAGLKPGDVILGIDNREVIDQASLEFRIAQKEVKEVTDLTILSGGVLDSRPITLELPPEIPERDITELDGGHPFQGVTIANLNPKFNDELQIDPLSTGVVVLSVGPRTPSRRFGFLQRGDFIISINGQETKLASDVEAILSDLPSRYVYQIRRKGRVGECTLVPNTRFSCRNIS